MFGCIGKYIEYIVIDYVFMGVLNSYIIGFVDVYEYMVLINDYGGLWYVFECNF